MVLYQPRNGYCYNSDTHFLFNFICKCLEKYKNINGDILDIGSGSGILGLLLANNYKKLILNQCEIQKSFQFFSQQNAKTNKIYANLYKGSFLDLEFDKKFDFCVSNPPFYHQNVIKSENESLKIARYNSSMPLKNFIYRSSNILKNDGKLFFCYDSKQLNEIILFLNEFNFNIEALQFVYPKAKKEASLVLVYAKKNSKSLLKILKPLIVFDENSNFTKEVEDIYKHIRTHSIKVDFE
ncbi:methyltransferase [Arcobacter sp. FW59]|nr:methyltransferase [Arcobacter sp. FW59]